MGSDDIEKVAQLQFSESRKKTELKELTRIANNVANNINQIAHRANVTNKVYKEDIDEIKELEISSGVR